jgi:hypothetical protein
MTNYEEEWHRQDNKDLVLGFISSMSKCNIAQMAAVLSPDVVWTIPGDSLVSGPAYGIDGIFQRCKMIHDYNARLDIQRMLYGPYKNFIAAELRNTGIRQIGYQNRGVIEFDEHVMMLFHIGDDGKIKSITNYISDIVNLNNYFQ